MNDFIERQGPAFLAHLLRRLSDELVAGADLWYPEVGVKAAPRTTSTLLALDEHGELSVTELAGLLRQSHPLVITWIRQLQAQGFVKSKVDPRDGRRTILALTAKGRGEVRRLREALATMGKVSRELMDKGTPGLFDALWRMEQACRHTPFVDQLREKQEGKAKGSSRRLSAAKR
ncbi:MarR family winged helix-turn-helix transcriptional regulator [Lysobacter sp. A378]